MTSKAELRAEIEHLRRENEILRDLVTGRTQWDLIVRNFAALKHEAETPMRGHDPDGECCRRAIEEAAADDGCTRGDRCQWILCPVHSPQPQPPARAATATPTQPATDEEQR